MTDISILNSAGNRPPSKIVQQTRQGSDIQNEQFWALSHGQIQGALAAVRNFTFGVTLRNEPSAIYNCHGLTFASRRTHIIQSDDLGKILKEDDYIEVSEGCVLPGDIVIYFSDDGDYQHSGIVVRRDTGLYNIEVVSKWGVHGCEVLHKINQCPYDQNNIRFYRVAK